MDESDLLGERGATAARRYLPLEETPLLILLIGLPVASSPSAFTVGGLSFRSSGPRRGKRLRRSARRLAPRLGRRTVSRLVRELPAPREM
jgi:hypothetical protein